MSRTLPCVAQVSFLLASLLLVAGCDGSDNDSDGGSSGSFANKITVTATPATAGGDFAYRVTLKNTSCEALQVFVTVSAVRGNSVLGSVPFTQPNLRAGQDVTETVSFFGSVTAAEVTCYQYTVLAYPLNAAVADSQSFRCTGR